MLYLSRIQENNSSSSLATKKPANNLLFFLFFFQELHPRLQICNGQWRSRLQLRAKDINDYHFHESRHKYSNYFHNNITFSLAHTWWHSNCFIRKQDRTFLTSKVNWLKLCSSFFQPAATFSGSCRFFFFDSPFRVLFTWRLVQASASLTGFQYSQPKSLYTLPRMKTISNDNALMTGMRKKGQKASKAHHLADFILCLISFFYFLLRSRYPWQQPIEEPQKTERDAIEKYPKDKNNNQQERKQIQYLTRFDNLTTSSEQEGREILLIQQSIQFCTLHIIQEGSSPLFTFVSRVVIKELSSLWRRECLQGTKRCREREDKNIWWSLVNSSAKIV